MKSPAEFVNCARRLKALADPERLKVVEALFAGEMNVSDLAKQLNLEIVNLSHHLGVLRNAGLVQVQRQGRFMIYSLSPEVRAAEHPARDRNIDLGCCSLELAGDAVKGKKRTH